MFENMMLNTKQRMEIETSGNLNPSQVSTICPYEFWTASAAA